MERVTDKKLQHLVSCINGLWEIDYGEIGSIILNYAYGSVSVQKLINEFGGVNELCGYCTKRECYNFLNGLYYGINMGLIKNGK